MGLLNKIFGTSTGSATKKEEKVLPWIPLIDLSQIEDIKRKSKSKTQVIFKHSTRCGISSMVQRHFINEYNFTDEQLDLYYLDILSYRQISDEVGFAFQLIHESPQLLVIRNGELVAHASHGAINNINLEQYI